MHSDFWAGVPYEGCPPDVQSNIRVIGRMDAFRAASRSNQAAMVAYVESLFQGRPIEKPKPLSIPFVDYEEMEFMMADDISGASDLAAVMLAEDDEAIAHCLVAWSRDIRRKSEYLAYNRKALEKRYRKGADQQEINRVKALISEGEQEVAYLQPRIEWATARRL